MAFKKFAILFIKLAKTPILDLHPQRHGRAAGRGGRHVAAVTRHPGGGAAGEGGRDGRGGGMHKGEGVEGERELEKDVFRIFKNINQYFGWDEVCCPSSFKAIGVTKSIKNSVSSCSHT